jgi:hypothetical protein
MPDVVLFPDANLRGGLNKSRDVSLYVDDKLRPARLYPLGYTYYGAIKYWTGTLWKKSKLKTYSGLWQVKRLFRWTGSEWKEINITGV